MKIKCIDIEWDTDHDKEVFDSLPQEVEVDLDELGLEDVTEDNSSEIADHLSDRFGFCLWSFNYQTI